MSHTLLRIASVSLSLSLVACAAQESGSDDAVTAQESAATTQAVEGMVVAMAPADRGGPAAVAAAYHASFGADGLRCATIATDNLTFVDVTFACTGPLATTGTIRLELTSPTTFAATADLTVGGVEIAASLDLSVPLAPSAEGSFDGELVIAGPRRMLTADAHASWVVNGACVTYSSEGSIEAQGPAGSGSATFEVDARTVCRQ
jgi:hypothetical protein